RCAGAAAASLRGKPLAQRSRPPGIARCRLGADRQAARALGGRGCRFRARERDHSTTRARDTLRGERAMTESQEQTAATKRVLIGMAHPDDGEFTCGGTVARWASEGRDIHYCLVTDGQVGDAGDAEITSEELAQVRQREAQAAADALGVQHPVIFLHYWDS